MRSSIPTLLSVPLLLGSFASAISIDCGHIRIDNKKFDLSEIGGPHSVLIVDKDQPPSITNTTWTIDVCNPLKKDKTIKDEDQCPGGTRVCGVVKTWNPIDDPDEERVIVEKVIPVAGSDIGGSMDPKFTRMKQTDSQKDGLQLEIQGGKYGKRKQKAVIQFQCDKNRTGNEGNEDTAARLRRRDDEPEDKGGESDGEENSLRFISYGPVDGKDEIDVLRLDWLTKYACEDSVDNDGDSKAKKAGWGFFTWFILIAFLGIAAYLIFGSWLNYNRYGARGWDLLPHGDTIRDIPYLFKDWSRKVADTVSGGGSRGGYSAV